MIRYNELAKVNAVETFRNELGGFKVGRGVVSFRSPTKCPVLAVALIGWAEYDIGLGGGDIDFAKKMSFRIMTFTQE